MNDRRMENVVSAILRSGVIISGSVVIFGGILYLAAHGAEATDYRHFHGQPAQDRYLASIAAGAAQLRARSVMQGGIVLLIGTPVARVVFALAGFALERDRVYVVVTSIVLLVLLYSLIAGTYGWA